MKKEKSVGGIIFYNDEGKILYLLLQAKYKTVYWEFPKGLIEEGENEIETLKREIKEETGLKNFRIIEEFRKTIRYFYRKNNEIINKEVVYYLVESLDKTVTISYEHLNFKWYEYEEARKILRENMKEIIDLANEFIKKTIKTSHLSNFFRN